MLWFGDKNLFYSARFVSAFQNKFIEREKSEIRTDFNKYFKEVNFKNFVKYFLVYGIKDCTLVPGTCGIDQYWQPYITQCGYCAIPYKVIGQMETMTEDLNFIGQMAKGGEIKKSVIQH